DVRDDRRVAGWIAADASAAFVLADEHGEPAELSGVGQVAVVKRLAPLRGRSHALGWPAIAQELEARLLEQLLIGRQREIHLVPQFWVTTARTVAFSAGRTGPASRQSGTPSDVCARATLSSWISAQCEW